MSSSYGKLFRVTIFGESHAAGIGVVVDGIPPGMHIDFAQVRAALARRAPNAGVASTRRVEPDQPEILSGCVDGVATGTPFCAIIRNRDAHSGDYSEMRRLMRPGHADYTGHVKYAGANDVRGGGHFSGRLTAPLVLAGSIAMQYLAQKNVHVGAHISSIGSVEDAPFPRFSGEYFTQLLHKPLCVNSDDAGRAMQDTIAEAAKAGDSVGGVVRCAVCGLPAGLGEPFFDSVESELAHMLFSIPAVKGVEFGAGFSISQMRGSQANDAFAMMDGKVVTKTNHNGGINGGITNGMPVVFGVAIKPTPSIARRQDTVDIEEMRDATIEVRGRHDACIVPRAVEVVRSVAAIVMMDLFLRAKRA